MESEIIAALEKFRSGDEESAFFELLEISGDVAPHLVALYQSNREAKCRRFLVKVAWQRRDRAALPFLGNALQASEEEIWQEALDGLVAFSSPESLRILRSARSRKFGNESQARRFRLWLEEAIEQVESHLRIRP